MVKMILEAEMLRKAYGDRSLLEIDQLHISDGDRIGLVGENGAGKSTLLGILSGEQKPDSGKIRCLGSTAMIRQMGMESGEITGRARSEFGAPENGAHLSGGEKTRRRLAGAFSSDTCLLFADEPTTDLDLQGIELLKKRLLAFRGAILLVSHDRDLLNLVCTRIWHLEDGKITDFPGNYRAYQEELQRKRDFQQFEYEQYREEQARLRASMQRLQERTQQVKKAPARMGNSEARLHRREATDAILQLSHAKNVMNSRLERLEKKERPRELPEIRMSMGTRYPIGAKQAITVRRLTVKAGTRTLLRNGELAIPTGTRTALMGVNGCGKTTLLRAICGKTEDGITSGGDIRINPAVRLGWFDQDHSQTLDPELSVLDNVMRTAAVDEATVRTALARMNLRGDAVFKPVSALSGGERAKAALTRLLVSDCNVLVLDEPTNHLDIFTLEELERMLSAYGGTLLVVSHDRTFVSHVANRILTMERESIHTFEGSLQELEAQQDRDRELERLELELTTLQMRQAVLSARMAAPQKGDSPEKLNADFEGLLAELREKKQRIEEIKNTKKNNRHD